MKKSIFINIAAYDDLQLIKTIESLNKNSTDEMPIRVGVCWQSDLPFPVVQQNVVHYDMPKASAKGVGLARWIAHQFYDGESHYLQIDSHTLFQQGWDVSLMSSFSDNQIRLANLLTYSSYAPGWSEYPNGTARQLKPKPQFNDFGVLRFKAGKKLESDLVYPPISCHFIFSEARFFLAIPHDPNIFYNGEEIGMTVRAFTNGYTNLQSKDTFVYHKYNQAVNGHPTIWKHNKEWRDFNTPSIERVKELCSPKPDNLGCYGKGSIRTICELEGILGVNFDAKTVIPR